METKTVELSEKPSPRKRGAHGKKRTSIHAPVPLEKAVLDYLHESGRVKKHSREYVRKQRYWLEMLNDALPGASLVHVKPDDLKEFIGNHSEGQSANTLRLIITLIKGFFSWCVHTGRLEESPAAKLSLPAQTETTENRRRLLHLATIRLLMPLLPKEHARSLLIMWSLGLRYGELSRIKLDNIREDEQELFIPKSKGRASRTVPIPDQTVLLALVEHAVGKKRSREGFNSCIATACKRAGVPRFSAHALRHCAATRWATQDMNIYDMGRWLGHRAAKQTMAYFSEKRRSARVPPPTGLDGAA